MLITFKGQKSGNLFTTPVRYVKVNEVVRCFSTPEGFWWRNLKGGANVTLLIKGVEKQYNAEVIEQDPQEIRNGLEHYLELYPQDADYHSIRLNRDGSLNTADLDQASNCSIIVEARPIS